MLSKLTDPPKTRQSWLMPTYFLGGNHLLVLTLSSCKDWKVKLGLWGGVSFFLGESWDKNIRKKGLELGWCFLKNQDDVHGTKKSMWNQTDWSHLPEDHTEAAVDIYIYIYSLPRTEIKKKEPYGALWSRWIETYQIKEVWTWQDFPKSQTIWMFLRLDVNTFQWI